MEAYLLKSGLALICFYFIYRIFIRHNQQFNLNRIMIIFSVLFASIIPVISINIIDMNNTGIIQNLEPIIFSGAEKASLFHETENSYSIFSIVYIIGLLVFAIRSAIGLATLSNMYRRFPKMNYHGFKLVILEGEQSPFTFFNILFISKADFGKGCIDELLVHEKVHKDYLHSFDLIFMEFMTITQWFNPAIWLFKYDLKSEHEFLADEQVLKKGFDKARYQSLLLRSHEGMALYLANNFNYSILKKRLLMMTMKKSKKAIHIRYAVALPVILLTVMVLFFNFQSDWQKNVTPDVLPEYVEGRDVFYKMITKNIKYPKKARAENIQGTIFVSFTVNKNGKIENVKADNSKYNMLDEVVVVAYSTSDKAIPTAVVSDDISILQEEGVRIASLFGAFKPAEKDGKIVSTRLTLPIEFKID